jgi:hypothetical protein
MQLKNSKRRKDRKRNRVIWIHLGQNRSIFFEVSSNHKPKGELKILQKTLNNLAKKIYVHVDHD